MTQSGGNGIGSGAVATMKSRPSHRPFLRKRRRIPTASISIGGSSWRHQNIRVVTKILVFGSCIAVIIGYTIVRMIVLPLASLVRQAQTTHNIRNSIERQVPEESDPHHLFDLPSRIDSIELWIAPTNIKMMRKADLLLEQELRQHMEQQCLPSDDKRCLPSTITDTERIGILRPPGRLGCIMEDYVTKFLQHGRSSNDDNHPTMTIVAQPNHDEINSSNNNNEWATLTKIIRPIVMPVLFEVFDLILLAATDTDDRFDDNDERHVLLADRITVPDVITTLRILIQYHCYIGQIATASSSSSSSNPQAVVPTLTISLHQFLSFPHEINDSLMELFQLEHPPSKVDRNKWMESYATTVFQLYDTATIVLQQIVTKYDKYSTRSSFQDLINSAIQEELHHDYCSGDLRTMSVSSDKPTTTVNRFRFDDTLTLEQDGRIVNRMTSTRNTEIIRTMLVENSLINVCHKYSKALLCSSRSGGS